MRCGLACMVQSFADERSSQIRSPGQVEPEVHWSFEILERVEEVAYKLALPPSLAGVHDVFHVSQLRRYVADPSHILDHSDLVIEPDHTFIEHPIRVLDRRVKILRRKEVPLLLIQWSRRSPEEATWETEESIRTSYPKLYESLGSGAESVGEGEC